MSSLGATLRGAAWLFGGRLAGQGLAVLLTVVLAARLGLAGFGGYAFLAAVVFVANVITTFGTDMALMRDIAAHGRADRWSAALAVQLGLSAIAIAAIWAVAPVLDRLGPGQGTEMVGALRLYSFSLIPAAIFSVATAGLRGAGRMSAYAALGAAGAALTLLAAWLAIPAGSGLGRVAAVLLAVQAVLAAAAWFVCASRQAAFRRIHRPSRADMAAMTRATGRIGLLGVLGVLYQRAGVLALAVVAGPAPTAWFVAASRVVEASKAGHVAWFGALFPGLAASHGQKGGPPDARRPMALGQAWALTIAPAALIAAVLLILGPSIIGLLYGPEFLPAVGALAILALSVIPSTAATHRSLELVAAGREEEMARVLAISLVVLIGLLAVLIPLLGWPGAAVAILVAETCQAAMLLAPGLWRAARGTLTLHGSRRAPRAGATIDGGHELAQPS